ncbi:MAG: peptide chain release factor N(5)-glutamine methyltransferase [Rickettsiales bacterium]|jgi:release factor glutamine methyltransferase|nr:peptide chain release factor N(5)-glutamine methyltransferase [Rickettsiales bacterium]
MSQKIKFLIESASIILKASTIDSSLLDSQLLLGHSLDKNRSFVICNPEFIPSTEQVNRFNKLVLRRKMREPISHILGYREFYSREFKITCDVLDPRPDTETLIDIVKDNFDKKDNFCFLDIGTGSGNITTTLLAEFANSSGFALDISKNALIIAKNNTVTHKVDNRVEFIQSDLFENMTKTCKFDLIISNPPYIPTKTIQNLEKEVSCYEPNIALDGGSDGLDFYKKISKNAKKYLKTNGKLLFEIGFDQNKQILDILQKDKYHNLKSFQDLAHNDRAILATS